MGLVRVAVLALLAVAFATPAAAIPDEDWSAFVDGSYSPYGGDEEPDWEDHLYLAVEEEADIPRALSRFGRVAGLAPDQAEAYAEVIVASVILRERCQQEACAFVPGEPAWERTVTPALAEPSGELLWVVGRNLVGGFRAMSPHAFIGGIQEHPARVAVLTRLYEYTEDSALVTGLLLEQPRDPALLTAMVASDPGAAGGPDKWDGWQLAVLEAAAARARAQGTAPEEQAAYAQIILTRYFNLGLTDEAVGLYRGLPEDARVLLPLAAPSCAEDRDEACAARPGGEALTDELVAALALAGDRDAATEVLARASARLGEPAVWDSRQRHLAVLDAFQPSIPAADLFELMVAGDGLDSEDHFAGMSGSGRMFLPYGPASRRLLAARLRDAGYSSIASTLERGPLYYRADQQGYEDQLSRMSFPEEVAARRAELAAAIEAAWTAAGPGERRSRSAPVPAPAGWRESRLPEGLAAWRSPGEPTDWDGEPPATPPELAGLPIPAGALLRHETVEGERYVLYQSAELDLPGEIPAYGVWLARTANGVWEEPAYLGLQQHFPWVVTPASALPLVEDGRLQIEVQVREIAPGSITFPPVALSLARQEDGVVISRPLAEVFADSDADGLTDIAEVRLGLDPRSADSDGDGRPDGADAAPLTAAGGPVWPARRTLALAILQQLTGHDAGAIVVAPREPAEGEDDLDSLLGGMGSPPPPPPRPRTIILAADDPTLFSDLDVPFRLLVYTPEQIRRLSEGGAPFYPPVVEVHSSLDGREHFVIWSASWVGGNFIARCPEDGGPCKVEVKSSWIT